MGKGISNRMHLNLPNARRALDVAGIESRLDESLRAIDRWANSLPFAAHGFHFRRAANMPPTAAGTSTTITWTHVLANLDKWMPASGSVSSIVVPRESSGLYVFRYSVFFGGVVAGQYPWVAVNGVAITNNENFNGNVYIPSLIGFALLEDGDVITAGNLNTSGAATTISAGGGGGTDAFVPSLQAWRIALLG